MPQRSQDVLLGELLGRQNAILEELRDAKTSRKNQYEAIEEIRDNIARIDIRQTEMETKLLGYAPTIEEFISIKQKVIGAGKLGQYLWLIGAALITAAYKFRVEMMSWFGK